MLRHQHWVSKATCEDLGINAATSSSSRLWGGACSQLGEHWFHGPLFDVLPTAARRCRIVLRPGGKMRGPQNLEDETPQLTRC